MILKATYHFAGDMRHFIARDITFSCLVTESVHSQDTTFLFSHIHKTVDLRVGPLPSDWEFHNAVDMRIYSTVESTLFPNMPLNLPSLGLVLLTTLGNFNTVCVKCALVFNSLDTFLCYMIP